MPTPHNFFFYLVVKKNEYFEILKVLKSNYLSILFCNEYGCLELEFDAMKQFDTIDRYYNFTIKPYQKKAHDNDYSLYISHQLTDMHLATKDARKKTRVRVRIQDQYEGVERFFLRLLLSDGSKVERVSYRCKYSSNYYY